MKRKRKPLKILGYCPQCGRDLESDYCDICQKDNKLPFSSKQVFKIFRDMDSKK